MHTFHQIIQYLFFNESVIINGSFEKSSELHHLTTQSTGSDQQRWIEEIYVSFVMKNRYSFKEKFAFLKNIWCSPFIPYEFREHFLETFSKLQNIYHTINRFAFRYKVKKAEIQIATDVFLNPIESTDNNVLAIYQNKRKYLFTSTDLVNIINSSLGNAYFLFSEPIVIKNPYTNMPFEKSILYSIYFFMRTTTMLPPLLFHHYFLCHFHLKNFLIENEMLLRDYAIEDYLKKTLATELSGSIRSMLRKNRYGRRLNICKEFPVDVLLSVMKPYLRSFYIGHYSLNETKRTYFRVQWQNGLKQFVKTNPRFGRKKIISAMFSKPEIVYNTQVIEFIKDESEFMEDHLKQHCEDDDRYSVDTDDSDDDDISDDSD